jgi:glycine dehydrogenase
MTASLPAPIPFAARHIGPRPADVAEMLARIGVGSLDELIARTLPEAIRTAPPAGLPEAASEAEVLAELSRLAAANGTRKPLIGQGYHGTFMPPVIQRNVLENPAFYTAYTPYQPEIAQGRLELLLAFQTLIIELSGMEIANASLLDEATAIAEAVHMARAARPAREALEGERVAVAADLHPQSRAVLATRLAAHGIALDDFAPGDVAGMTAAKPFAVVLQYPGSSGEVRDLSAEIAAAHRAGALAIVAADPLALVLLRPPGAMGADIVVGSAQRFGVPMGFGGPHAAFLATREALKRLMPGRLVGVSRDAHGAVALRLALQTREQHIRREKATSNICTAQALLAMIAALYAMWHGPEGLRRIAARVHAMARALAGAAEGAGFQLRHRAFFDTIALEGAEAAALLEKGRAAGFDFRPLPGGVAIALDETVSEEEFERLLGLFGAEAKAEAGSARGPLGLPAGLGREGAFLTHPLFNAYHTEHAMLRYLRRLAERDIALDRSMIPLGSCTMKLNPTAALMPLSWPGFADRHPFAPEDQSRGYRQILDRLANWLAAATGMAAVSLQPNSGAQGELAGLLTIRAWHEARGEGERRVCLIPASAHGTNPASAVMAGFEVVVVATDKRGNVDLDDLRAKIAVHRSRLAALMITYPSTHGVFEASIREICAAVHEAGGQVYMDGANLNAMLGLSSPGAIGADVCHINLHKTFAIPHGGGGPGAGPIAVAAHLVPYLPGHPCAPELSGKAGPVAAAPYGSALILIISYAYIRLMGGEGLREASRIAILNANYIAARLRPYYPVLYTGEQGMVAHECILDCRGFAETAGVTVEDIAKRLQDFGFHAPTMSWPVAGTLMVEPTESEGLDELERFCQAMIRIREEIDAIAAGRMDRTDNPLKNAPHTIEDVTAETWTHPYSRTEAAFPLPFVRQAKYWPPVGRIDNVYGDRHLVCTCAPLAEYAEAAE